MTTTEQQIVFEQRVGMNLISSHTFNETSEIVWHLRIVEFKGSKRKSWVMWCERNGDEVIGTRKNGRNITSDLNSIFKL